MGGRHAVTAASQLFILQLLRFKPNPKDEAMAEQGTAYGMLVCIDNKVVKNRWQRDKITEEN